MFPSPLGVGGTLQLARDPGAPRTPPCQDQCDDSRIVRWSRCQVPAPALPQWGLKTAGSHLASQGSCTSWLCLRSVWPWLARGLNLQNSGEPGSPCIGLCDGMWELKWMLVCGGLYLIPAELGLTASTGSGALGYDAERCLCRDTGRLPTSERQSPHLDWRSPARV